MSEDILSEDMLDQEHEWEISPKEGQARRVLVALGYRSCSRRLPSGVWMHSIYRISTGQCRIASIHADVYETMAIAYTVNKFNEEPG